MSSEAHQKIDARVLALKAGLLVIWALVSFVLCWFAPALQFNVGPWPFFYWMAAQGALLVFIAIVGFYAWAMDRLEPEEWPPLNADD